MILGVTASNTATLNEGAYQSDEGIAGTRLTLE